MILETLFGSPLVGIAVLGIVAVLIYRKILADGENGPPGPWGLPLVGYLPFLDRKMNVGLTKLSKKYGDVFQLRIGTRKIVVINGNDTLKKALAPGNDSFSGRPDFFTYRLADTAFGFADWSPRYRTLRKIGVKSLGMFANARNEKLEEVAQRAGEDFIEVCKARKNEPFNPKDDLYQVVCGIMGFICYGKQFTKDDQELQKILGSADEVGKTVVAGILVDYIPSFKFLMSGQINRYKTVMGKIRGYSAELVTQVLKTYVQGKKVETVADAMQRAAEEMSEEEKRALNITDQYITGMIGNMFGAGFGTIAITIRWAMMLMATHPEIQQKLFNELNDHLGEGRVVNFGDVSVLHYLNCCVSEIYRFSSIASVAITHCATKEVLFEGYHIPKGTPVIPNLYSGHYDDRIFTEPTSFNPDRFLQENGQFDKAYAENSIMFWMFVFSTVGCSFGVLSTTSNVYVFPYGLGHRRCGGEALAKLEIVLFLATIFHRCHVCPTPGEPMDPLNDYNFTFGLDPKPFRVILKSRYGEW